MQGRLRGTDRARVQHRAAHWGDLCTHLGARRQSGLSLGDPRAPLRIKAVVGPRKQPCMSQRRGRA